MIYYYNDGEITAEIDYSIFNESFSHEFGVNSMPDTIEINSIQIIENPYEVQERAIIEMINWKIEDLIKKDIENAKLQSII